MSPNNADGMANSVDSDQTAPLGAVWSGSTLFAQTAAVLCPWARHFTPRKYWLITQEAMAPSRYDWKIVDWDVKHQHKNYLPRHICLKT